MLAQKVHSMHTIIDKLDSGHALAELLATGDGALVQPAIGVYSGNLAGIFLNVHWGDRRFQQRQEALDAHPPSV